MIAIDASRLSGAAASATEAPSQTAVAVTAAEGPQHGTAAPAAPAQAGSNLAAPALSAPPVAPAAVVAPQPDAPAPVRVVGPPIDLRPSAPTNPATPAAKSSAPRDGNGFVMLLIAVIVGLLGTVFYMTMRSKAHQSSTGMVAQMEATKTQETAIPSPGTLSPAVVAAHGADRIDLAALVPAVSPETIAASPADMVGPTAPGPAPDIQENSAA